MPKPAPRYRYQCPKGHQWNAVISRVSGRALTTPNICPSCGYMPEDGKGPIIDHGVSGIPAREKV